MKRLLVFGTGAHARKVAYYARLCGFAVAGFVDERVSAVTPIMGVPVLRSPGISAGVDGDVIFVAIGDPVVRRRIMDWLAEGNWPQPAIIHPSAVVAPDAKIGDGALIAAGCIVETLAVVGRGSILDIGVLLDHDCVVSDFEHAHPGKIISVHSKDHVRRAPSILGGEV